MDDCVIAYLEHKAKVATHNELRHLAAEIREKQAKLRPMQKRVLDDAWAKRRKDGPTGFVMVRDRA